MAKSVLRHDTQHRRRGTVELTQRTRITAWRLAARKRILLRASVPRAVPLVQGRGGLVFTEFCDDLAGAVRNRGAVEGGPLTVPGALELPLGCLSVT